MIQIDWYLFLDFIDEIYLKRLFLCLVNNTFLNAQTHTHTRAYERSVLFLHIPRFDIRSVGYFSYLHSKMLRIIVSICLSWNPYVCFFIRSSISPIFYGLMTLKDGDDVLSVPMICSYICTCIISKKTFLRCIKTKLILEILSQSREY